jgi:hypothetical protein
MEKPFNTLKDYLLVPIKIDRFIVMLKLFLFYERQATKQV